MARQSALYPIMMDLASQPVLVVGGGIVALRKIEGLIDCGAQVKVVAKAIHADLRQLAQRVPIVIDERPWRSEDVRGVVLVIAATNDRAVNVEVNRAAREMGVPVNVVDVPDLCSFYVPAIYRNADLCIAISSAGSAPMYSGQVRRYLEQSGIGAILANGLEKAAVARKNMDKNPPRTYGERVQKMGEVMTELFRDINEKIRSAL